VMGKISPTAGVAPRSFNALIFLLAIIYFLLIEC
jgi:hypothetical protein